MCIHLACDRITTVWDHIPPLLPPTTRWGQLKSPSANYSATVSPKMQAVKPSGFVPIWIPRSPRISFGALSWLYRTVASAALRKPPLLLRKTFSSLLFRAKRSIVRAARPRRYARSCFRGNLALISENNPSWRPKMGSFSKTNPFANQLCKPRKYLSISLIYGK